MDVANPMNCVIPSAQGPVLAVLAATFEPLTGRRIATLTRPPVSVSQVATILRGMTESGLVGSTPAGSSTLFVLNRDHVAAPVVVGATRLREELWERIVTQVHSWDEPPLAVIVFGSAARGDGDHRSDIDLLLVRPEPLDDDQWQRHLTTLADAVLRWSGNPCEILDRSEQELASMASSGEPLLAEIRRDGHVLLGSWALVGPRAVQT